MGCCGGSGTPADNRPGNEAQPGDIVVQATFNVKDVIGHISGRVYRPRTNFGLLNVDPRDVAVMPRHFAAVQSAKDLTPDPADVLRKAGLL